MVGGHRDPMQILIGLDPDLQRRALSCGAHDRICADG
jgi:hypothetical protein